MHFGLGKVRSKIQLCVVEIYSSVFNPQCKLGLVSIKLTSQLLLIETAASRAFIVQVNKIPVAF